MIPVEGYKHLYRDEKSGAIVSTDSQGYLQYKKLQQQKKYQENLDNQIAKEFALESKKFDSACLNIAKALIARVGTNIRDAQNQNTKEFTPQQLDSLAGAAMKIQKFAKIALGESTEQININANIQEADAFREAMELLDTVAEQRREANDSSVH